MAKAAAAAIPAVLGAAGVGAGTASAIGAAAPAVIGGVGSLMSKGGGGGSSGQAQQSVDPAALAAAQGQANIATAQTTSALNNINTTSPFGSSIYTPFIDPQTGQTRYSLNQQLTPQLQDLFNRQTGLAGDVTGAAGGALARGGTLGGMGMALTNRGFDVGSNLPTTADFSAVQNLASLTPGSFKTDVTGGAGGQALPGVQTGVGSNLPIQAGVAEGGPVQGTVDTNFGDLTKQAQDAAYQQQTQYLDPQYRQGRQQLIQQLADQGLQPGTEAYDRATGDFDRQQQMAYQSAQSAAVQAGNEQQRALFGEAVAGGQFANQAQQQRFGQDVTRGTFANQAEQQDFAQRVASGEFGNQAQQQMFGQGFQLSNLYNQAVLGAAGQNVQAQQGNLQRAQAAFQDPMASFQALLQGGQGLYGSELGGIGAALPAIGAAPTWPISIPTMGGSPATVQPTNLGDIQRAATAQNQFGFNAGQTNLSNLIGGANVASQGLFGRGLTGGGSGGGLFGNLFNSGTAVPAFTGSPFAAGTPIEDIFASAGTFV